LFGLWCAINAAPALPQHYCAYVCQKMTQIAGMSLLPSGRAGNKQPDPETAKEGQDAMDLRDYLSANHREDTPRWLTQLAPGQLPATRDILREFFRSRIVFYPGSGSDGSAVKLFNESRSAHCFLYVDYGLERGQVEGYLTTEGFRGYRSLARMDISERDFGAGQWNPHVCPDQVRYWFPHVRPYAFLEILEKEPGSQIEGAERLAILFLAADGHATYDALFCQDTSGPLPFCVVVQDHGFGGNYSNFGEGGLIEGIAQQQRRLPPYLLVGDNTTPWGGYVRLASVGGVAASGRQRFLHKLVR